MVLGSFAFYYESIGLMMITLTGLGFHSAFFGPAKYAILPDHLPEKDLLGATGLIEASTFVAILLGTTLGTLALGSNGGTTYIAIFMTVFVALAGLFSSLFIPATPPAAANLHVDLLFWRAIIRMLKHSTKHTGIFLAILILSWFWFLGAVVLTELPDYTHYIVGGNTSIFALFLAMFSTGIALGSLIVNFIFKGRLCLTIVPFALFACGCFIFDLYLSSGHTIPLRDSLYSVTDFFNYWIHWRIALDLFLIAFSAGLFVVPLYTYLQVTSTPEERARTIALNNIYNSLFMVLGTLMIMVLLHFNRTILQIFLGLCFLNSIVAFCSWYFLKKIILTHES